MSDLNFTTIMHGSTLTNKNGSSVLTIDKNTPVNFETVSVVPTIKVVDQIKEEIEMTKRKFKSLKVKQWKLAIRKRR